MPTCICAYATCIYMYTVKRKFIKWRQGICSILFFILHEHLPLWCNITKTANTWNSYSIGLVWYDFRYYNTKRELNVIKHIATLNTWFILTLFFFYYFNVYIINLQPNYQTRLKILIATWASADPVHDYPPDRLCITGLQKVQFTRRSGCCLPLKDAPSEAWKSLLKVSADHGYKSIGLYLFFKITFMIAQPRDSRTTGLNNSTSMVINNS